MYYKETYMRGKYIPIGKDILIKTYENNKRSLSATAKELGTSTKTIVRRMKDYDIKWDKKVFYSCNENFFDELNEKSLYWLGFLAADGNVYKHNYSYEIKLKIANKDLSHIKQFKNDIDSMSPIHDKIERKIIGKNGFKKSEYLAHQITI